MNNLVKIGAVIFLLVLAYRFGKSGVKPTEKKEKEDFYYDRKNDARKGRPVMVNVTGSSPANPPATAS